MGALLMLKVLIPLLLFASAFLATARHLQAPVGRLVVLVLILSNVMAFKFFLEVTSEGSWQVIGTSVSHFGIMNVQVLVVLLLFAIAHVFVGGVQSGK
jgi:GPI ethanolamine phosphate transferase 1